MTPRKYYSKDLKTLIDFVIGKDKKVLEIKEEKQKIRGKYDFLILKNVVGDWQDVQSSLSRLKKNCAKDGRVLVTYYNHLWEPAVKLASVLRLRRVRHEQNWLDNKDLNNLLQLSGFEVVNTGKRLLVPVYLPFLSGFLNKWVAHLPIINSLCLTTWVVARVKPAKRKEYSVTILIPARNEEGNIPKAIPQIPKFGTKQEIIFVEGHSNDDTWGAIQKEVVKKRRKGLTVKAFHQKGKGKGDAVRLGFSKATGQMLMILDADLTVSPKELPKFYEAIASGQGEYINGSRLVYPMEGEAMRILNKMGNKVFSWLFTWILGQRFRDTLCGTKVLLKSDYEKIVRGRKFFGDFDPFGDFDLIFGAVKQNMKVVEIPVRYKDRTYGSTNISRFRHGLLLLQMTWFAFRKFRAW